MKGKSGENFGWDYKKTVDEYNKTVVCLGRAMLLFLIWVIEENLHQSVKITEGNFTWLFVFIRESGVHGRGMGNTECGEIYH